ncbi:sigma-70 family RNA polymerase sigma factor [Methylobacillus gramineus]|uniref:sigma-70 family RNA polymerase sigma factor n=1 Tax=Methylobacillus gramineus TaxID=755169 RepID=UPI001CFF6F7B|nr:sigma-70 family RNA polymerase sigma factor [Methylobacillus gramineus]MCB5185756.1 sigma-70 family RNA polymerase sigma factor [Methylobacillus gramineus]
MLPAFFLSGWSSILMGHDSLSRRNLLSEWYSSHHSWLVSWLRRKMDGSQQADDLAQDTFIRVFKSQQLEQVVEPRAFLTVVAKRELYNFWRRRELETAYLDALSHMPEHLGLSQEDYAVLREAILIIDRQLDGLPEKVKQAFLLNRLEGMTYVAISQEMHLSVATIERYMKQAILHCHQARLRDVP